MAFVLNVKNGFKSTVMLNHIIAYIINQHMYQEGTGKVLNIPDRYREGVPRLAVCSCLRRCLYFFQSFIDGFQLHIYE